MSIHHLLTASGAGLLAVVGLATPAAAQLLVPLTGPGAYALTAGRFWSLVAALIALAGVVVGGLALARPASRIGTGRRGASAALAAGLAGAIIGGLVVAGADGGPGSGSGIVGGFLSGGDRTDRHGPRRGRCGSLPPDGPADQGHIGRDPRRSRP